MATSLRGSRTETKGAPLCPLSSDFLTVLCRPGGISGEPEPDPIPNSAVKLPSAGGTKSPDLEEYVGARRAKDVHLFIRRQCQPPQAPPRRFFVGSHAWG